MELRYKMNMKESYLVYKVQKHSFYVLVKKKNYKTMCREKNANE